MSLVLIMSRFFPNHHLDINMNDIETRSIYKPRAGSTKKL